MAWHRIALLALALLMAGGGRLLTAEKGAPKQKRLDPREALAVELGFSDKQKQDVRKLQEDFDKKIVPVRVGLWEIYKEEGLTLTKALTEKQKAKLPEALKAMRYQQLQKIGSKLGMSDEQKAKLVKLGDVYGPKFRTYVGLPGPKVHRAIADLRLDFREEVRSQLTEAQRAKLPAVLREEPGLPAIVHDDAALAFLLITGGLGHFAQGKNLDVLADKLDLSAEQKTLFQKTTAEFAPKLAKAGAQLLQLERDRRAAIEAVLTDQQRTRWREMRKANGE